MYIFAHWEFKIMTWNELLVFPQVESGATTVL